MKHLGKTLISRAGFSEIVMGNTAIVRAMVEANVKVVTSYPGSPTPEIASAIKDIPKEERPFYFEFSVNEKVATEVAFGASLNGHLSCVFFKSVGLNVASDIFVQLGLLNLTGGMIVILGDDPGANSSQNEQDNRNYAYMSNTPVFEPATPGEVYTLFLEAAKVAQENQMPVIFRLTTHVCHAKEKVEFKSWENTPYDFSPKFDLKNGPYVMLTSNALQKKRESFQKLSVVEKIANKQSLNILHDNGNKKRGIITFGAPYLSLMDVLQHTNDQPDILKISVPFPAPKNIIKDFLDTHQEVKVLEELDNLLERDIIKIAYESGAKCKIIGKIDTEDYIGEYTSDKVYDVLGKTWADLLPKTAQGEKPIIESPLRSPQLCPGCGHRPVFTALRKCLPANTITVGDIGCHTLGFLPPHEMGSIITCMGHSVSTASGLSLFNNSRKVVAFLGDSTFYHAGLPAIVNAMFNKHNITLVILPNGTTGMTGHQDHAGTGHNFNEITDAIPVKQVLLGLGVKNIRESDAYNQAKIIEHIEASLEEEGLSVVIAEHPCMLKKTREQKKNGTYLNNKINILQDECTKLMTCVSNFGCPSFQIADDGTVWVHEDLCIGDGSCIQTCKAKAIKLKKK